MKALWQAYRRPVWALALLSLAAFWFATFAGTLSVNHEYDSLSYALTIEEGGPLFSLFHPHHLIYNWLARQWHVLLLHFGFSGRGMLSGQLFDCLIGSSGIVLLCLALYRACKDGAVAFLAAVGMASTYGYWHASNILAVRILNCVALCAVFYFLSKALSGKTKDLVLLGLAHGFSILCHQTNALLTPAIVVTLLCFLPANFAQNPLKRFRQLGLYLLCYVGLAGSVYLFVGIFVWLRKNPAAFGTWLFSYLGVQEWTRVKENPMNQAIFGWSSLFFGSLHPMPPVLGIERRDIRTFLLAFLLVAAAWIFLRGWWMARRSWWMPSLLVGWLCLFQLNRFFQGSSLLGMDYSQRVLYLSAGFGGSLWMLVVRGWYLGGRPAWALLFCLFWLGAYLPFFYWWEPWNLEFWLSCLPPVFILLALAFADMRSFFSNWQTASLVWRQGVAGVMVIGVFFLFLTNLQGKVAFDAQDENNRYYNLLESLKDKLRDKDLLVLMGNNGVPMYLSFFQPQRRMVTIYHALKRHPEEPSLALEEVENTLRQELHRNRVYLLKEILIGDMEDRLYLQRNFDLDPDSLKEFTSRFVVKPVPAKNQQVYFYRLTAIKGSPSHFH